MSHNQANTPSRIKGRKQTEDKSIKTPTFTNNRIVALKKSEELKASVYPYNEQAILNSSIGSSQANVSHKSYTSPFSMMTKKLNEQR